MNETMTTPDAHDAFDVWDRQQEALEEKYKSLRKIVHGGLIDNAEMVLKQCNLVDLLILAMDHPQVRDEMPVLPTRSDVAFAVRDFPACIEGYIDDTVRDMQ